MLFNADILAKLYISKSQSWKTKKSKGNFQQKVENMKQNVYPYAKSAFEQPGPGDFAKCWNMH